MKRIAWIGLIPLTAFWLFAVDIYGSYSAPFLAFLSALCGIAVFAIGFMGTDVAMDKRYAAFIAPIALSCFVIPYPYNLGLIIVATALAASFLAVESKGLLFGVLLSGVILSVHTLTMSIYYIMAPSFHNVGWLSPFISFISNISGLETASNEGILFVYGLGQTFPFTITLEKLGFYPWILIFAGALALICLTCQNKDARKRILILAIVSASYLLLRFLVLLHIFLATDMPEYAKERMEIFIDPFWLLASFIPLVLLLFWLWPIPDLKFDFGVDLNRRFAIASAAILLSIFFLTSSVIFLDPGTEKEGRVLVDEIHSVWEFSTLKLDKEWYGVSSTYNAYSMVEWLDDIYDVDRIVSTSYANWSVPGATKVAPDVISDTIDYDILKNYDILIIKTPSYFESVEVDAITRFVEMGGGLFLIGDHTNFAGSGTNLNQIAKRFGIEFGFDSVNTQEGTLYQYKRGLLPNPCTRYMPYLDFMTGCSIRAPVSAEPVILGFGLNAVPGEYASTGFFRETRHNDPTQIADTTWGLINQAVAVKYGKGRVVAFSDSTIISNFRIFFGGTPNFIIGSMEYLNYSNRYQHAKLILLILGLLGAAFGAYLLRGDAILEEKKLATLIIVLALGSLAASCALLAFSVDAESSIPSHFYDKNTTVCFDGQHSDRVVTLGDRKGDYETFFVWTQRISLTPTIENTLDEAMEKGRTIVIIDPVENFTEEEQLALVEYVQEGNSVLLMISSTLNGSELVRAFGMELYSIDAPPTAENNVQNRNSMYDSQGLPIKPWGVGIEGGDTLLSIDGRAVMARASFGDGKFVLFMDSEVFKDGINGKPGYMGYPKSDPSAMSNLGYDLRALYDLEFRMFEGM